MNLDIFFRFSHLFVFLAIIIYCFKKFYLQDIKNKIKEEKDNLDTLEFTQKENSLKLNIAKSDTEKELESCEAFNTRVVLWKENFEKKRDYKIEQVQQLRSALNSKISYQLRRYEQEKIEAQMLPDILNGLEQELYNYYSSGSNAKDYMSKIVASTGSLKKSSK